MAVKKRAKKFRDTTREVWPDDFVYRREGYVFRRVLRWWLTAAEVRALVTDLSKVFNSGREPTLKLSVSRRNNYGGVFTLLSDGREILRVRGTGVYRSNIDSYAADNKCREVKISVLMVPPGKYSAHVVLHEYAHYLSWIWWADGSHKYAWSSANEAVQEWFARKRKNKGSAYRVVVTKQKRKTRIGREGKRTK